MTTTTRETSMTSTRSPYFLAFCLLLAASSQAQPRNQKATEFVKRLSTSILDSTLPRARFSEWLAKVIGDNAVVQWEVNDCGEQTGDPAVDSLRDIPICVGVYVTLADHRKLGIMIAVGTHNKGLVGDPEVFDMYLESEGKFRSIRRLSDLQSTLKQSLR
jgi:hypothetical protein